MAQEIIEAINNNRCNCGSPLFFVINVSLIIRIINQKPVQSETFSIFYLMKMSLVE